MANYIFTGLEGFPNQQKQMNSFHPMSGRSLNHLEQMTLNDAQRSSNFNSVNQVISSNPVFTPQNVPMMMNHPSITFRPSTTPNTARVLSSTVASSVTSPSASSTNLYQSAVPLTTPSYNRPYFHADFSDTILFESWIIETAFETFFTCALFLFMAIALEAIKFYREHLLKQFNFSVSQNLPTVGNVRRSSSSYSHIQRKELHNIDSHHQQQQQHPSEAYTGRHSSINSSASSASRNNVPVTKNVESPGSKKLLFSNSHFKIRLVSFAHFIQTCLYLIQLILTYILIMGIMTFNMYICLSIVFGSTIGYWLFFWRKVTIIYDENTTI